MEKYIAYQTVDCEHDIWSNVAILFSNNEKVEEFFKDPMNIINTLEYPLENYENVDTLKYEIVRSGSKLDGDIVQVIFYCEYAGKTNIQLMYSGYLIK